LVAGRNGAPATPGRTPEVAGKSAEEGSAADGARKVRPSAPFFLPERNWTASGSVRYLAVQQEGNPPGTTSVYAVVGQTYANNKSTSLGSDVVRLTADLQQLNGTWKTPM